MTNHVIRIVTDIVTTTESVTEIEKVIVGVREIRPATVTKAVTDRVKLRLQKKKKIRVKTKEATTMRQKRQANKDSDILAALLYNKMIFNYSLVVYMHNSELHTETLLKQFCVFQKQPEVLQKTSCINKAIQVTLNKLIKDSVSTSF